MTAVAPSVAPTVVLLVGDTGVQVHEQLSAILDLIGPLGVSAGAIELLHVEEGDDGLRARSLPLGRSATGTEPPPAQPFGPALSDAARRVFSLLTRIALEREGQSIANDLQVLIAGAVDDWSVGDTLEAAALTLAASEQQATVCYLLEGALPPAPPATHDGRAPRHLADFTFLFTDRIAHPAPAFVLDGGLRRYVLAQALVALVATGIPLDQGFDELVRNRAAVGEVELGSIRTCLVAFPRGPVEEHCAASVGVEAVAAWRRLFATAIEPGEGAAERARAGQAVQAIRQWLDDTVARPGSDPDRRTAGSGRDRSRGRHRWPGLGILRRGARDSDPAPHLHQRLVTATERLFGVFSHDGVDREARERSTSEWTDIAYERIARAPDLSWDWRNRAKEAWSALPVLLTDHVRDLVNGRWAAGDRRLALLHRFVEECDEQLTNVVAALGDLRVRHHERYTRQVAAFQELAGPWLSRLTEPALDDEDVAEPRHPARGQEPPTHGDSRRHGDRDPRPASEVLGDRLTVREDRIASGLRERVRHLHARVPPPRAAITTALLALVTLGLPALVVLAPSLTWLSPAGVAVAGSLLVIAVVAGSALVGGAAHLAVRRMARRRERMAQTDLLRFLCLCYAHRCERVEDRHRVTSLGPLRWWVQRTLHALEDVDSYLACVLRLLGDLRLRAEGALFDSPSGLLDVLVAEGGQLVRRDGDVIGHSVTLEDVLYAARRRMGAAGRSDALADAFLAELGDATALVGLEAEELADRLVRFGREALGDAIAGDVPLDVHRAVLDPVIQRRTAGLLESPLYGQFGTMQARVRYKCGRPPTDDATGLPPGRLILGRQRGWWLLASLFAGGSGPLLDDDLRDRLFHRRVPDAAVST